jgi:hypothetical protein
LVQNRLHGMLTLDLTRLQLDTIAHNAQLRMSIAQARWLYDVAGCRFRADDGTHPSPPYTAADLSHFTTITSACPPVDDDNRDCIAVRSLRYQAGARVLNCVRTNV